MPSVAHWKSKAWRGSVNVTKTKPLFRLSVAFIGMKRRSKCPWNPESWMSSRTSASTPTRDVHQREAHRAGAPVGLCLEVVARGGRVFWHRGSAAGRAPLAREVQHGHAFAQRRGRVGPPAGAPRRTSRVSDRASGKPAGSRSNRGSSQKEHSEPVQ
ncbi:unnamed protein product [Prorocentrum cordatum]|uniref:Uncharacterized protein n=1 Tax=Prorocentrum cordatum TaxID=2364126 RepID=A0ABN9SLH2_9DINO|nr:unnamed protein product [Polarella glacialis]